jgi:hypothetical protein
MRSLGKGVRSATTQVKVSSPEIIDVALGQGFHILEASIRAYAKGECAFDVPGSKTVAGKRTVYIGTWENRNVPNRSRQEAERVMRRYGVSVVGLTRSRGVGSVMTVASSGIGTPEGVSGLTRRDRAEHATH